MNINRITNFVILILVVTAVYQTGMLWLGNTASHNFFYTVFTTLTQEKADTNSEGGLLLPTRFAVGSGNGTFSVFFPEEEAASQTLEKTNDFLYEILEKGSLKEGKGVLNWDTILGSRCVAYEYDFLVPLDEYRTFFSKVQQIDINYFDHLVFLPAKQRGEPSKVFFVFSKEGKYLEITLEKSQYAVGLYQVLENLQGDSALSFVSTGQSGFKLFEKNVFVPQWIGNAFAYSPLKSVNPFMTEDVINRGLLENSVEGFFKNFAADWNTRDENGDFIFSDDNVVVKYNMQGMLEYFSYKKSHDKRKDTLLDGYQVCKNFMKNDKSLKTGVVLVDVKVHSNEIIYYFDYVVQDFPILLSEDLKEKIDAEHAIEVVVRNHAVKNYRRYAMNFIPKEQPRLLIEKDFLTALNEGILSYQKEEPQNMVTEVETIYLGYLAETVGDLQLHWFTKLYDKTYIGDTQKAESSATDNLVE